MDTASSLSLMGMKRHREAGVSAGAAMILAGALNVRADDAAWAWTLLFVLLRAASWFTCPCFLDSRTVRKLPKLVPSPLTSIFLRYLSGGKVCLSFVLRSCDKQEAELKGGALGETKNNNNNLGLDTLHRKETEPERVADVIDALLDSHGGCASCGMSEQEKVRRRPNKNTQPGS